MLHELKLAPEWFDDVAFGIKTFEIRKDDRGYAVGDILRLREWEDGGYTGFEVRVRISSILTAEQFPQGLREGYVILSIHRITDPEQFGLPEEETE